MGRTGVRYLEIRRGAGDKLFYYYNPPKEAIAAGAVSRKALGADFVCAKHYAEQENRKLERWRSGAREEVVVEDGEGPKVHPASVEALVNRYKQSRFFAALSERSKKDYERALRLALAVKVGRKVFAKHAYREVRRSHANELYDALCRSSGKRQAAYSIQVLRRIWRLAMREWEKVEVNPFEQFALEISPAREQVWEPEDVRKFWQKAVELDKHSIGLIALMQYELMQRHGDVRMLTKDQLRTTQKGDEEVMEVWFRQSKRGTRIWLRVPPYLAELIRQQIERNPEGCQYICATPTGKMWDASNFGKHFREIKGAAGISARVTPHDLRRTAATEAGNSGATEAELMAQGGWRSSDSVKVYVQTTREQAIAAQEKRSNHRQFEV